MFNELSKLAYYVNQAIAAIILAPFIVYGTITFVIMKQLNVNVNVSVGLSILLSIILTTLSVIMMKNILGKTYSIGRAIAYTWGFSIILGMFCLLIFVSVMMIKQYIL